MLYPLLRRPTGVTLRYFFPRIYMANTELIPTNKPVLLVSNHPTTFTEPCILACFLTRPLYYLVRGDFFEHPLSNAALRDLHMMPIYRQRDGGYKNLKNNFGTIQGTYEWLSENKTVMILAEGTAIHEKRLRPIRKGPARIALHAMNQDPEMELYIVPVGVNYTNSIEYGTQVMVNFDKPFLASEYFGADKGPKGKAINAFTKRVTESLQKHIIIIENPEDDWLVNQLLMILRNNWLPQMSTGVGHDKEPFLREKKLTDRLNQLPKEEKQAIKKDVKAYIKSIETFGVADDFVAHQDCSATNSWIVYLGYLPYQIGRLIFSPPVALVKYITNQKIIFNEFYASVQIAAWLGSIGLYLILLLVIGISFFGWLGVLGVAAIALLGHFTAKYKRRLNKMQSFWAYKKLNDDERQSLQSQRSKIFGWIEQVMKKDPVTN